MIDFCRNVKKKIYIYGCGRKGKLLYRHLIKNHVDLCGFIISDGQEKPSESDIPVYYLSEIDAKDAAILIGVSYVFFNQIFPGSMKKGISDIYFFNGHENYVELQKHDTWFFEKHENEEEMYQDTNVAYKMAQKIFKFLIDSGVEINSAIDIGGGLGVWLRALKDLNHANILVLDGSDVDRSKFLCANEFRKCDLSNYDMSGIIQKVHGRFDIAVTIEVAEHLDEICAEAFIDNLCTAADIVLFSAAIKCQGGNHHVNEQMQSYWADKFLQRGYKPLDCIRKTFWNDSDIDFLIKQNCILYVKNSRYEELSDKLKPSDLPLDIVHPELYLLKITDFQNGLF